MIYPWKIIGHQKQLLGLEKQIRQNSLSHAYFFHGPEGIGKHTIARTLAKILMCPHDLCHQCQSCRLMDAGTHPDFIELKDEGESLKIDEIRALAMKTNLTPQGERRVVLIENMERMPVEAQNAFLKTLEEPAGKTIFLLTSSEPRTVLPTILSRVRKYEFGLVEDEEIKAELEKKAEDSRTLESILEIAQGRPGMATRLLEKPMELSDYRSLFLKLEQFLNKNDLLSKFGFVEELEKNEQHLNLFFEVCASVLRKSIRQKQKEGASKEVLEKIYQQFEKLMETRYLVNRNINKKLALENFFLETET